MLSHRATSNSNPLPQFSIALRLATLFTNHLPPVTIAIIVVSCTGGVAVTSAYLVAFLTTVRITATWIATTWVTTAGITTAGIATAGITVTWIAAVAANWIFRWIRIRVVAVTARGKVAENLVNVSGVYIIDGSGPVGVDSAHNALRA